jgi:broad specificity phosphatase PhoE
MKEIFLLRHGATPLTDRYVGASDIELSDKGKKEISSQGASISRHTFSTIFCSPLKRCVQTGELLKLSQDIIYDARLREIDFGKWEGKTFAGIVRTSPDLVNAWCRGESSFGFPEGEKLADFHKRIGDFADTVQSLPSGKVLIITHGGVIRHLICRFLNLPYHNYLYFKVECGKLTMIEVHSEGGILSALNRGSRDV